MQPGMPMNGRCVKKRQRKAKSFRWKIRKTQLRSGKSLKFAGKKKQPLPAFFASGMDCLQWMKRKTGRIALR